MRVLLALTYYRPHISGLTIYAERLARGLAARGHRVTVLTSRAPASLPAEETLAGVRVVRAPVLMRVSKGVVMPTFAAIARRLLREHDVLSLHLPQFDAAPLALLARAAGRPSVLTYQCDLALPRGAGNRVVGAVVALMNAIAGRAADRIVASSDDYARHSRFLRRFAHKVSAVSPPIELPPLPAGAAERFREARGLTGPGPFVGMAARLAAEKGAEVLARAMPRILERHPGARVLFAGPHERVVGERAYAERLERELAALGDHWTFLGILEPDEMAAFFSTIDVIVVPSLNSTEAFGLVQVEAMLSGTPSIASDLPGVRQAVAQTGMGEVTPVGDAAALAAAVLRVLDGRARYVRPREEIEAVFGTGRCLDGYERIFGELAAR